MPDQHAKRIVAGASCVTINPLKENAPMVGYRDRPSAGVALDLCLRAIVFGNPADDKPAAALLALDTLTTGISIVAALRARAATALPGLDPTCVMIAATHTHSAPTLDPLLKGGPIAQPDPEYVAHVLNAAGEAVTQAWKAREQLSMRVGLAEVRLNHNRRAVDPAGKAVNEWKDPEGRHHGYCNPIVRFLTFCDAATGHVRIALNTYGCHPVVLGPMSPMVSPDYPGYLVRALEATTGARVAVHVTGAAADINPRECIFAESERARPMGEAIARAIVAALPAAQEVNAGPISAYIEPLTLTLCSTARENYTTRADQSLDGKTLASEIQALRLGDVALISAPGELFAQIGLAVENSSPFAHTLVVGYANDSLGYLCTEAAIREGGYEASTPLSTDVERPILAASRRALEAVKQPG